MEFKKERKGEVLYLAFSGNIIFEETTEFSLQLESVLPEEASEVVLDFSEVTGITSSAIGAVIDFHQKLALRGRKMRIKGMSEKAHAVFKYFKLDQLFPIER